MKQDYSGLSRTTYTTPPKGSGSVLTLKKLEKTFKYFTSKKYLKKVKEEEEMRARGHMLVGRALSQGIINEAEYLRLLMSIEINGFLLVSLAMGKRLEKVTDN